MILLAGPVGQGQLSVCPTRRFLGRSETGHSLLAPERVSIGLLQAFGDPGFDVAQPVPEVPARPECPRPLAAVSPRIERGQWHVEVDGEFPGREYLVEARRMGLTSWLLDAVAGIELMSYPDQRLKSWCSMLNWSRIFPAVCRRRSSIDCGR